VDVRRYDTSDVKFAEATLVKKPSMMDVVKVAMSLTTLVQVACYFVTFGSELSVNSNLSSFYISASGTPAWSQTLAANWAAMYGLLNVIARPLGGYISDSIYPVLGVEGKKYWMIFCMILP
jgi:MFS transporter, NNP family, nitrate/nitrite transporter